MFPFSFTTPSQIHRYLAMVALFVMLAGKTVHVHQDCADCCTDSVCETDGCHTGTGEANSKQVSTDSAVACPFGCDDHLEHGLPTDLPGEESDPVHETHNCAVCSVLAAAPDCPLVVGLPEWSDLVQPAVLAEICLPDVVESRVIRLRGPPLA